MAKVKRFEPLPLPPSLDEAFAEIENLDAMHPSSRGQAFGAMIHPASHDRRARMTQDAS
jgi:hypothetical protein